MKLIAHLLLWVALCVTSTAWAENPNESEVKHAYQAWCSAIGNSGGKPQEVVKFYAPNAILLATFSPKIIDNLHELNSYFKQLLSKPELRCTTTQLITQVYGQFAINSGLYTFSYAKTLDHKKIKKVPARFTFVYRKMHGQWLIINHHSSVVPEGH